MCKREGSSEERNKGEEKRGKEGEGGRDRDKETHRGID